MQYLIYKLTFPRGYHASSFRLSEYSILVTADLLFSGIIHQANKLGGQERVDRIVEEFSNNQLLISDLFPYIEDKLYIRKPLLGTKKDYDLEYKKELKKLDYIDVLKINAFRQGKLDPSQEIKILDKLGESNQTTQIAYKPSGEHEIYHVASYHFYPKNGLYFILGYQTDSARKDFEELLDYLALDGIGGKRSLGYGHFSYEKESLPQLLRDKIDDKSEKNILMTTSMAREEELDSLLEGTHVSYNLERKGGFILPGKQVETRRKKDIYFFSSGSIFDSRYEGDIYRVDDNYIHPVYRYGKGFFMGVEDD